MSLVRVTVSFRDSPDRAPLVVEVTRAWSSWIHCRILDLKESIKATIQVPVGQLHLFVRWQLAELDDDDGLLRSDTHLEVLIESPERLLKKRLPHIATSVHSSLGPGLQRGRLDLTTVKESLDSSVAQAAVALRPQVIINIRGGKPNQQVTFEREALLPFRLLPDGSGVELRGKYSYSYRAASAEYVADLAAAVERRTSDIAHCRKLLHDLPIALANSMAALQAHCAAVDVELNDLGAMALEQYRVRQEIDAQQAKLKELEASPVPQLVPTKFTIHQRQTSLILRFGVQNRVAGEVYTAMQVPAAEHEAAATQVNLDSEMI